MKIDPSNEIDGVPVKDLVDMPHGAFATLVRVKHDPNWGLCEGDEPINLYKIEVCETITETRRFAVYVEAQSEQLAEVAAFTEIESKLEEEDNDWCVDDVYQVESIGD